MLTKTLRVLAICVVMVSVGLGASFSGTVSAQEVKEPETVTLEKGVFVTFKDGDGKRVRGEVMSFGWTDFVIHVNRKASDKRTVKWSELEGADVFKIHNSLLRGEKSAYRWYQVGALLMRVKEGGAFSVRALATAERFAKADGDEKLLADIKKAREYATTKKHGDSADVWGLETKTQHEASVKELKTFADAAMKHVGKNLTLYETDYFLLYTDLDAKEGKKWASVLDRMYDYLCKQFDIKRGINVWRGKCIVFIYKNRNDYASHLVQIMRAPPAMAQRSAGVCQSSPNGRVHLAMFRQPVEREFAHVLVHEAAHGFVHRYRAPQRIANWANEGLVEIIAEEVTKSGMSSKQKIPYSHQIMKQRKTLSYGGSFFDLPNIQGWQYGAAADFSKFLLKISNKKYIKFFQNMKDGMDSRDALKDAYGKDFRTLVEAYGRTIGVRGLQP